jgi:MFS family permease
LVSAVLLLPVLVRIEKKAEDPVIEVNLLKSREVKIASSISIGTGLNQTAIVFLPAFAVTILALTTSQASLMVIPLVITLGVSAPLIGRLLDKFGSKRIIFFGTLILVLGLSC